MGGLDVIIGSIFTILFTLSDSEIPDLIIIIIIIIIIERMVSTVRLGQIDHTQIEQLLFSATTDVIFIQKVVCIPL
jgi:hypothetical protein